MTQLDAPLARDIAPVHVRRETFADLAWPRELGTLYRHNGLTLAFALTAGLVLFLVLVAARTGCLWCVVDGGLYGVLSHELIVGLFVPVFGFAAMALGVGVRRIWRWSATDLQAAEANGAPGHMQSAEIRDEHQFGASRKRGCRVPGLRGSLHLLTWFGLLSCLAATCVAAYFHHALKWMAPYPLASAPKLLGVVGGFAVMVGTVGLLWPDLDRHASKPKFIGGSMDAPFTALLLLVASSGFALMRLKYSAALPLTLCVHLGAVMALFATLPYGKFAHGIYRSAARLKRSIDRHQLGKHHWAGE
jgi:citrate/tricarballylate utilization protein